jgi:fumarylacetoacetase
MRGFRADNLPYGVTADGHVVVAYGSSVIDLAHVGDLAVGSDVWSSGSLNGFMALGPGAWAATRTELQALIASDAVPPAAISPADEVDLVLPFTVADYADFYASEHHATNAARIFRPDAADPLPPAWRHLPIGYHGRAGTVVVSGTPIDRPRGLAGPGRFGPSQRLDVEVELGFVVGVGGTRLEAAAAMQHVFGVVLVNDWSARDIQFFESTPLGPFLGKSFATSISPWVVPLAALEPFRVPGPPQEPVPADYLRVDEPRGLDISLELSINGTVVSRTNTRHLYWSMGQDLAHLTVNGASVRTGDLFASGTVSGPTPDSLGCLLELSRGGAEPFTLDDGSTRTWLEDGDVVTIEGWAGTRGGDPWVSLGTLAGRVQP